MVSPPPPAETLFIKPTSQQRQLPPRLKKGEQRKRCGGEAQKEEEKSKATELSQWEKVWLSPTPQLPYLNLNSLSSHALHFVSVCACSLHRNRCKQLHWDVIQRSSSKQNAWSMSESLRTQEEMKTQGFSTRFWISCHTLSSELIL